MTGSAATMLWRWLIASEPQGYWFSRPLWPHVFGGLCLLALVIYALTVAL